MRQSLNGRLSCAMRKSTTIRAAAIEALEGRVLLTSVVINSVSNTATGAGVVTLDDAVSIANASSTPTMITFDPTVFATPQTITALNSSELQFANAPEPTTIAGPSAGVTISGVSGSTTGINTSNGASLILSNLTLTKFAAAFFLVGGTTTLTNVTIAGNGYGIENAGNSHMALTNVAILNNTVGAGFQGNGETLNSVTVSNNGSPRPGSSFGGLVFGLSGQSSLIDCTISNNTNSGGGAAGIEIFGGSVSLTNVTISGNSGTNATTGGLLNLNGDVTLSNCTVVGNSSDGSPNTSGFNNGVGGIITRLSSFGSGRVTIANSIIAGNSSTNGAGAPDLDGSIISNGHNLVGVLTSDVTSLVASDLSGTSATPLSANLGPLADNGGATKTLLPLSGSPAIDHGSNALIPSGITTDQRGLARIANGTVDIGAVEAQARVVTTTITVTPPAAQSVSAGVGKNFLLGSFTQVNATAPFGVDVNWGDGTADSKFTVATAGTIPATAHAFATAGAKTVTITVTDAAKHTSNKATYSVIVSPAATTGSISGVVFSDTNANGKRDAGEKVLAGVKVYIDAKKSGSFVTGDPSVVTSATGVFTFTGLAAGTYRVREVLPGGYKLIAPAAGFVDQAVAAGKAVTGVNFADAPATASISGVVFNDGNVNQKFDPAELGLDGWQVYIDTNKDGKFDAGDLLATTDINGAWSFAGLTAGAYAVRVVQVAKTATTTAGGALQTVTLSAGQAVGGKLFGEERIA